MILRNRIGRWLAERLSPRMQRITETVPLDGERGRMIQAPHGLDYLARWYLVPRNDLLNVYLHVFIRSDDARACHDHPYVSASLALSGQMKEIYLENGAEKCRFIEAGDIVARRGTWTHRMVVLTEHPMTLFITGPRFRPWYFWCEGKRPIHWEPFTETGSAGCD